MLSGKLALGWEMRAQTQQMRTYKAEAGTWGPEGKNTHRPHHTQNESDVDHGPQCQSQNWELLGKSR